MSCNCKKVDDTMPKLNFQFPSDSEGMKFDNDKRRWDLMDFGFLDGIVDVLTLGANKYSPENWRNVERDKYKAALMRHISAYMQDEKLDEESGLSHLLHVACNLLFLYVKDREEE